MIVEFKLLFLFDICVWCYMYVYVCVSVCMQVTHWTIHLQAVCHLGIRSFHRIHTQERLHWVWWAEIFISMHLFFWNSSVGVTWFILNTLLQLQNISKLYTVHQCTGSFTSIRSKFGLIQQDNCPCLTEWLAGLVLSCWFPLGHRRRQAWLWSWPVAGQPQSFNSAVH